MDAAAVEVVKFSTEAINVVKQYKDKISESKLELLTTLSLAFSCGLSLEICYYHNL